MAVRVGFTIACLLCAGLSCHGDRVTGLAEAPQVQLQGRWYVATVNGHAFPFVWMFVHDPRGGFTVGATDSMWFDFEDGAATEAFYQTDTYDSPPQSGDTVKYSYTLSGATLTLTPTGTGVRRGARVGYAGDTLTLEFVQDTGSACVYALTRWKGPRSDNATNRYPC